MYRLCQWPVQPVQKCSCCSYSDHPEEMLLWFCCHSPSDWVELGPEEVSTVLHRPWDIWALRRTTRTVKLCTGRAWVNLCASKVRQSLRSLCGSFGLRKSLLTFLRNIIVLLQSSGVCGCHVPLWSPSFRCPNVLISFSFWFTCSLTSPGYCLFQSETLHPFHAFPVTLSFPLSAKGSPLSTHLACFQGA